MRPAHQPTRVVEPLQRGDAGDARQGYRFQPAATADREQRLLSAARARGDEQIVEATAGLLEARFRLRRVHAVAHAARVDDDQRGTAAASNQPPAA